MSVDVLELVHAVESRGFVNGRAHRQCLPLGGSRSRPADESLYRFTGGLDEVVLSVSGIATDNPDKGAERAQLV